MTILFTLTIPLVTVPIGRQTFGPAVIPAGATRVRLEWNRSVGLLPINADAALRISYSIEVSLDGGSTWDFFCGGTDSGGTTPYDPNVLTGYPIPGDPASSTRMARATMATNNAFTVSGRLILGA